MVTIEFVGGTARVMVARCRRFSGVMPMTEPITLRIPCVPVAQPRIKATSRGGHAAVYTPTTIRNSDGTKKPHPIVLFKATLRQVASAAYMGASLEGPLLVNVVAVFPRPKLPRSAGSGRLRHTKKPDRDNLDKAILDGLRGIIFRDDRQVCDGRIVKVVAAVGEQPHVEIEIVVLEEIEIVPIPPVVKQKSLIA